MGRIKGEKNEAGGEGRGGVGRGGGRNADSAKTLATDKDGGTAADRQTRQRQCTL